MKIVKFKNGSYGIRKFNFNILDWNFGYSYYNLYKHIPNKYLINNDYMKQDDYLFEEKCQSTDLKTIKHIFNLLTDKGKELKITDEVAESL